MKPRDLLVATYDVEKGTAVISATPHDGSIIMRGASCRVNVAFGEYTRNLVVVPEKGVKDVIAIDVTYWESGGKNGRRMDACFLLQMDGGAVKPVNLDAEWVPPSDRLAALTDSLLVVEIEGKRFFGREYPVYGSEPSGCYTDPNILCRYLVGKATAEEVKAAAKEFRNDELMLTQKQQKELRAEVERLDTALAAECEARKDAEMLAHVHGRGYEEKCVEYEKYQLAHNKLMEVARDLYGAARDQWFKSALLRHAISKYEQHCGLPDTGVASETM